MGASPKTYELTFIEQPNYFYARITANFADRDHAMSFLSEVMTECANRRCKHLLLDRCLPYPIADDQFLIATDELIAMDSGTRIAFLYPQVAVGESFQYTSEHQTETDRDYGYFRSRDQAVAWLLEESNGERTNGI